MRGPWLRRIASVMALAASVIHLAQIGPHLDESWAFAAFFLVVGIVQLIAAALLLRPWAPIWFWLGIIGSGGVIAIWLVSRTAGLPFGLQTGPTEAFGTADAASSLCEAITVVVLALWLADRSVVRRRIDYAAAVLIVVGMGVVWAATRALGLFDPDPRATIGLPELADRAVIAVVIGVAGMLGLLATFPGIWPRGWPSLLRGLLLAVFVASGALVGLTLPAAGGQNASCTYAPLAEVSHVGHDVVLPPARLEAGEERWFPALLLSTCGPDVLRLELAKVLNSRGRTQVLAYALLPVDKRLPEDGAVTLPSGSLDLSAQPAMRPGQARQLVVRLRGSAEGFNLDSLRIGYRVGGEAGNFGFAAFLSTCPSSRCAAA